MIISKSSTGLYRDFSSDLSINSGSQVSTDLLLIDSKDYPNLLYIPVFVTSAPEWVSTEPTLTVPDLQDSVEALFRRRSQGLPETFMPQTQRDFPTDPALLVSASSRVASFVAQTKASIAADTVAASSAKILADKQEKQRKIDAQEFAAFQANKGVINP